MAAGALPACDATLKLSTAVLPGPALADDNTRDTADELTWLIADPLKYANKAQTWNERTSERKMALPLRWDVSVVLGNLGATRP